MKPTGEEAGAPPGEGRGAGIGRTTVSLLTVYFSPLSMTDGAQQALRRIMEIYSKTTRFALACNASDKIIEPIQSRCAVLRYSKLTDGQILARLQEVVEKEALSVSDDGLEAVIFTAQGDMRQVGERPPPRRGGPWADFLTVCLQALNNLQSTNSGFGFINSENVFKVCDEPHPLLVKSMLGHCVDGDIDEAYRVVEQLWALGYSPEDIIGNIFRVCKTYQMAEYLKLEFIKVRRSPAPFPPRGAEVLTFAPPGPAGDRLHAHEGGRGGQLPPPDGRTPGETLQQDGVPRRQLSAATRPRPPVDSQTPWFLEFIKDQNCCFHKTQNM